MCRSSPSPLDMLETTFHLLAGGPEPLALDGCSVGLRGEHIGLRDPALPAHARGRLLIVSERVR